MIGVALISRARKGKSYERRRVRLANDLHRLSVASKREYTAHYGEEGM